MPPVATTLVDILANVTPVSSETVKLVMTSMNAMVRHVTPTLNVLTLLGVTNVSAKMVSLMTTVTVQCAQTSMNAFKPMLAMPMPLAPI